MKMAILRGVLAFMVVLCSSCGLKPAQDYVVIGTLSVGPSLQSVVAQARRRGPVEVVMTARLSPDVSDVVIQRRWKNPNLPLEFGLGKGRFPEFEGKGLYVTAELILPQLGSLVGFSSATIPAGTEFVELVIDRQVGDPQSEVLPGYPTGGFSSKSVREEATPPGAAEFNPGSRVVSGRVEVPPAYQAALRGARLFVVLRERADRGAPELILPFEANDFPQSFALHQAHRIDLQAGSPEEAMKKANQDPIMTPKFVLAQIDLDGNLDTKDDLFTAATDTAVEVGRDDVVLRFKEADLERLIKLKSERAKAEGPKMPSGHGGAGTAVAGHGQKEDKPQVALGGVLAAGELSLPKELAGLAKGAELWFSIRDPKSGKMMDTYRQEAASFPLTFSLENGAGMMSMAFSAGQGFVVKAILTTDGLMSKTALVAHSAVVTPGTKDLKLTLAEQAQEDGEQ